MKVLWFTNTPSQYDLGKHQYHGGGWIESLEGIITNYSEIELALAFFHPEDNVKVTKQGVTYYPILQKTGRSKPFQTLINNWRGVLNNEGYIEKYLNIIRDFQPDVIQVFGTEGSFGTVQEHVDIPVIIHLQGLINPCVNAYFPTAYSKMDFIHSSVYFMNSLLANSPFFAFNVFQKQGEREKNILKKTSFVTGRTEWDKQITKLYNPNLRYFHIDEVLRPIFYEQYIEPKAVLSTRFYIISTLSPTVYKGIDVVLKTAKRLKELTDLDFEWKVIGLDSNDRLVRFFEQTLGINHKDVGITLLGKMDSKKIVENMLEAAVFVHPTYIDNSPNSICEAQILGLPVICSNVGGLSSLVKHGETGLLVPSNGVYEIVHYLKLLCEDSNLRTHISKESRNAAIRRHNRDKIATDLVNVYKKIMQ